MTGVLGLRALRVLRGSGERAALAIQSSPRAIRVYCIHEGQMNRWSRESQYVLPFARLTSITYEIAGELQASVSTLTLTLTPENLGRKAADDCRLRGKVETQKKQKKKKKIKYPSSCRKCQYNTTHDLMQGRFNAW
ncbi:hypothetical protein DFH09DRAFT_1293885 [Mycena vulgaris]|nr:hypothetical protein DFH09DRAFT_1293885 [Mycena vulgaris]